MRRLMWVILAAGCALTAACDKNTPLMDKVVAGDTAAVSALIAKGADVNAKNNYGWTALSHAARAGNAELVKLLLAHGADVNARDGSGWTPLMRAAMKGHAEAVRVLLEHGALVNVKEKDEGWTALHWAAARGYEKVVKLLLSHGADYTLRTQNGLTPLMLAMRESNDKVAQVLQDAGERE
jgi:ankyrin repeat protein